MKYEVCVELAKLITMPGVDRIDVAEEAGLHVMDVLENIGWSRDHANRLTSSTDDIIVDGGQEEIAEHLCYLSQLIEGKSEVDWGTLEEHIRSSCEIYVVE